MTRMVLCLAAALLASASGCSDPSPDGDADSDSDQDGDQDEDWDLEIEPPTPPAPPVLTPCPEGWVEVPPEDPSDPYEVATCDPWPEQGPAVLTPCPAGWREIPRTEPGGVATCDPWPEGGMQECEGAEAHFPGEPGCRRIGSECPEGEWAEGLPETGTLFVRAGAPSGGAGTRASPFGTIAEATAAATEGATIALSKGTFDEAVVLPAGVTLRGACVRDTVLAWSGAAETDATITVRRAGTTLRDVTIGGEGQGVLVEGEGTRLDVQGVLVSGAKRAGVLVQDDGALNGEGLVVRGTRGMAEPDTEVRGDSVTRGYGLWARRGGRVDLGRTVVEASHEYGALADGTGTEMLLAGAVVRGTRPQEIDRRRGDGLGVFGGARAELRQVVAEQNRTAGVIVSGTGSSALLEDVIVRDTQRQQADSAEGPGLWVEAGARAEVARSLLERNRKVAVRVTGARAVLSAHDVVVRDTLPEESDDDWGSGLWVQSGARAEVSRSVFERNREVGLGAWDTNTALVVADVLVRDTQAQESDGYWGRGLEVGAAASGEVTRALFERSRAGGVSAWGTGAELTLHYVVVRDSESREADGLCGQGLEVADGAWAEVTRTVFERNRSAGILAISGGTTLAMEDVIVRDTLGQQSDGMLGFGLELAAGAQVALTRATVEGSRIGGIDARGGGTTLTAEDLTVRDTLGQDVDGAFGTGLSCSLGAQVTLARAAFERNRSDGIAAFDEATTFSAEDVVVRDTQSQQSDGSHGGGLSAVLGAHVSVARALLERNRAVAVSAFSPGSELVLHDAQVRDTLPMDCWRTTCVNGGAGSGVGAFGGAHVEMTTFRVTGSALCGVQLAHGAYIDDQGEVVSYETGGTMDLHEGEVSSNLIGANVQTEGFDLYRLMDRVIYCDNGRNLDSSELPVPDLALPPDMR